MFEQRVDRRGLARSRRAGDDQHADVAGGETLQAFQRLNREAEVIERSRLDELRGHAEGGAQTMRGGHDREAKFDRRASRWTRVASDAAKRGVRTRLQL